MQSSHVQFVGVFCDKAAGSACGNKEVVAVQLCEKGEILEFLLSRNAGRRAQLLGHSACSAAARSALCSACWLSPVLVSQRALHVLVHLLVGADGCLQRCC